MKPIKLVAIFALVVALLVGGFSVAIAAATGPVQIPELPITLMNADGSVEVSRDGGATWTTAADGDLLEEGDKVRTGVDSFAAINFFDQGVTRLDAETTVTIDEAAWDSEHPETFTGSVMLETGRLWARLFDFLSADSSFDVQTTETVAAVRGTVFSVWTMDGMDGVYVDDHRVHVEAAGTEEDVTEGWLMMIDPKSEADVMSPTKDLDRDWYDWVMRNRQRDAEYDAEVLARWKPHVEVTNWTRMARRMRLMSPMNEQVRTNLRARFQMHNGMMERLQAPIESATLPETAPEPTQTMMEMDTTVEILIDGVPMDMTPPIITNPTQTEPAEPVTQAPIDHEPEPVVEEPVVTEPEAPYPVSLTISAGAYTLEPGQQTILRASLLYSDDSWADVSTSVNWDVFADPESGMTVGDIVSVNRFRAGDTDGTATVQATYYTDTGRVQSDPITISVVSPVETWQY